MVRYTRADNRTTLNDLVAGVFPLLLTLAQDLVQKQSAAEPCLMLKTIFKVFYVAINIEVPLQLRELQTFADWSTVLLTALATWPAPEPPNIDPDMRHKTVWWKARKWSLQIFYRIIQRYSIPAKQDRDAMAAFSGFLNQTIGPAVLKSVLHVLEVYKTGVYVAPRVLHASLSILEESVAVPVLWQEVRPVVMHVITDLVFPFVCHSDADDAMWNEDPLEFVRTRFDIMEDYRNPAVAAKSFIHCLATRKKKVMLMPILMFANDLLGRCASDKPSVENARRKDGLLCILGCIAEVLLKQDDLAKQLEKLVELHVFPEFDSPYPFLRARACWLINAFASMPFANPENCIRTIRHLMNCLCGLELPVKVYAAIGLETFVAAHESVHDELKPNLPKIMSGARLLLPLCGRRVLMTLVIRAFASDE